MISLKMIFELLLMLFIIWFFFKDSRRIFKAFFLHLERKLLVVHSIKLGLLMVLIYKFNEYIGFYEVIMVFISILLVFFLSLLTLKHVEFKIKGTINSKYKTFKYGSKFVQYVLYLIAVIMNFGEIKTKGHEIKEKTKEMMYVGIFPVQKYIMVSVTSLEFTKRRGKFITDSDLKEIRQNLKPGDILLKRNDWQATNLGISGFWTHSGLFIGGLEELDEYFSDIESLKGRKFSERLKELDEKTYKALSENSDLSVIEAIEEGVVVKPLSNIAKVDYFAALRPRASKEQKMNAILTAYSFLGRPYDYYINMESNDAFICTEVIKKSFENIITFQIEKKLGKKIVLPNSIVRKFVHERGKKNQELDFVLFYDLDLKTRRAYKSTEFQFGKSYKRSIVNYRKMDMLRYLSTILEIKN